MAKASARRRAQLWNQPLQLETRLTSSPGTQTQRRGLKLQTGARAGALSSVARLSRDWQNECQRDLALATERLQLSFPPPPPRLAAVAADQRPCYFYWMKLFSFGFFLIEDAGRDSTQHVKPPHGRFVWTRPCISRKSPQKGCAKSVRASAFR